MFLTRSQWDESVGWVQGIATTGSLIADEHDVEILKLEKVLASATASIQSLSEL